MVIVLHGKRLEASLPNVAAHLVMPIVTPHMSREEPLHPSAQIPISPRPYRQMEVLCEALNYVKLTFSHV